jgi:hypothetical protein
MTDVRVLYSDEHGTDLLIGDLHNVNLGWARDTLSGVTHETRNGSPMQVLWNGTFRSYFVATTEGVPTETPATGDVRAWLDTLAVPVVLTHSAECDRRSCGDECLGGCSVEVWTS